MYAVVWFDKYNPELLVFIFCLVPSILNMDNPPPKPPRRRLRLECASSCPSSPPESNEADAGHAQKMLETSDNLEQPVLSDGVLSDGMPVDENAGAPKATMNPQFQAGDTVLKEVMISNSSMPISVCENTVVDGDPQSSPVIKQAMFAPSACCMPENPPSTSHTSDNFPHHTVEETNPSDQPSLPLREPGTPPHLLHSNTASPTHELEQHTLSPVHTAESSHDSSDSVFVEEVERDSDPPFQSPRAESKQEPGSCTNTQCQSVSSVSSSGGYATADSSSLPSSPHHESALSSPHSTASATDNLMTTTPPDSGMMKGHPSHGSSESEREREAREKGQEVTAVKSRNAPTKGIKSDTSWIGRESKWSGSPSQRRSPLNSGSADQPISLVASPTSFPSAEDHLPVVYNQPSSHGPLVDSRHEEGSPPIMKTWQSSDHLTKSVDESHFSRINVRSRSFDSSTVNRIGGKVKPLMLMFYDAVFTQFCSFLSYFLLKLWICNIQKAELTASSTIPRSSTDSFKDTMKKLV